MPVHARLLLAALLLAALAGGQIRPERFRRAMPPEIVVAPEHTAAPPHLTVELDNAQMRVVRARIGGFASMRSAAQLATAPQGALVVAVTPLDVRMVASDGKTHDAHLAAGRTEWISGAAFAFQNLAAEDCEFLWIETRK